MELRFVREIAGRDVAGAEAYFRSYLERLARKKPVLRGADKVAGKVLMEIVREPARVPWRTVPDLLQCLLGTSPDPVLFPSEWYRKEIENVVGRKISQKLKPEVLLPFRLTDPRGIPYNPEAREITSEKLFEELLEIYTSEPEAVVIVSKFIDWKGFYRFATMLEKARRRGALPKTFIVTAEPIFEEIRRKYNIVPVPTRSHSKILAIIGKERYCYFGSMNVLAPSPRGDFLLAYPRTEWYCMKYLLKSVI